MNKLLTALVVSFAFLFSFLASPKASEKVKVYMFEAGGCPYCEAEEEYLKSLDSYGTKFELVKKELYIDHINWEPGKDYQLGKKVAEAFLEKGFDYASYTSTPFVVISDIYAAASYNTSLEEVINEAYEKGDKDVVGQYENDLGIDNPIEKKENNDTVAYIIIASIVVVVTGLVIFMRKKAKSN